MFASDAGIITNDSVGCNLSKNIADKGYNAALFYLPVATMPQQERVIFASEYDKADIEIVNSINNLILVLKSPRIVFIVSKENDFSETIIPDLLEYLEEGDIIVDTCDMDYKVAADKARALSKLGICYIDAGFSREMEAALGGASFMPGGLRNAYDRIRPILTDISSKVEGFSCCPYIGKSGTGQYVKMVHNGIEYAVLQLICEAICILKAVTQCDNITLKEILTEWNAGELESHFLDVITDIVGRYDARSDVPLVDIVLDKVGYSDSVVALCISALELSSPITIISDALNIRFLSNMLNERIASSDVVNTPQLKRKLSDFDSKVFTKRVKEALYLSIICVHAQAFSLLQRASCQYFWNLNLLDIAKTYQGGSLIRSKLLYRVIDAFAQAKENSISYVNILNDTYFKGIVSLYTANLRETVSVSIACGLPMSAMQTSLAYLDNYTCSDLPTGLIQLVRDYIGVSGYARKDFDDDMKFYADWQSPENKIKSKL